MRCSSCKTENADGAKFCVECGISLAARCAKCGHDNPVHAKFCANCAAPLKANPAGAPVPTSDVGVAAKPRKPTADGERRHLTVLFCDLVSSTEIATRLDPEEWHAIAAQYQQTAADAVIKIGGHVAKYLGDGLVVYFGYPQAQEDAAERAVRAGLAILEIMTALNARFSQEHKITLSVRVGIHTGSVVVAHGGGKDADMFGDAPNIASRVQSVAAPDTVVMTAAVHDLVSGLFRTEGLGAQVLKGIDQPVHLYRVISSSLAGGRGRGFAARAATRFVGREDEVHLLLSRWNHVRDGEGQLVLMMGEPGIGKTRLIEEFRARI